MMRTPFLVLTGLAALAAGAAARADEHSFNQQVNADPHGTVEISNVAGKVEVSGWDQPQVSVQASFTSGIDSVDVESHRGRTTIAVRQHGGHWSTAQAYLQIKIPRSSDLEVNGVSAHIVSTGVIGTQQLKTVSGSINADISQADVEAKTLSGEVVLRGDGKPGTLHVSSISGSIKVDHWAGDMEAASVSGSLTAKLDSVRSVRARTTSGRMEIEGKLTKDGDLDLQTVSGSVRLRAGYEGGYEYEAHSFSGHIDSCFNQEPESTRRYGLGRQLNGTRGNGSAHVRVKTMSGEIELCDKP
jgi:DUF4097 and DUF4098 domain-containing protein YvlB